MNLQNLQYISGFEVTWEETFPWQNDSASCGVFVLMYMSHKLGLLTFNPDIENISVIQNGMVEELLMGVKRKPKSKNKEMTKRCITATRYKQAIGNDVILYCSTSGGKQEKFTWTFNGKEVSN